MNEIELRFEALQRHLEARREIDPAERTLLQVEGDLFSAQADKALFARLRARQCNDDRSADDAA